MSSNYPKISIGKRAVIAGQTGSGKSILACWLLNRSPGHWIILNPKWTTAYDGMIGANVIRGIDYQKIEKSIVENRITIVNPMGHESTPEILDEFVANIHNNYNSIGLCCDELYTLHSGNARPGPGLVGWLTRGRELKQSFLGLTQRPSWISKFLFSEADYIGSMRLNLPEDRKKMYEVIGDKTVKEKLAPLKWFWYDVNRDFLRRFAAVPFSQSKQGDTDHG
jgi:hypothetical protein